MGEAPALRELLAASMEVPHVDDDGLNLWAYSNGAHPGCRFCSAIGLAELVLTALEKGLAR